MESPRELGRSRCPRLPDKPIQPINARLLVIRGGAIGDFVLTLPALKLLREGFPDCHIEIMAYRRVLPLVNQRFYANSVRCIEYGPMAACFNPKAEMAAEMADYFLSFGQIISFLYDPDTLFRRSLEKIGVKNFLSISPKVQDHEHASSQLAKPLSSLALFLEDPVATFHHHAEDLAVAEPLLHGLGPRFLTIHTGSGSPKKNWPVERWGEVISHLLIHASQQAVVVVGGEADSESLARMKSAFGTRIRILENLPLNVLGAVLSKTTFFLGHDSGISHLAAASGAPCLLLYGPTDPRVWAPCGKEVKILQAPNGNLENIQADDVLSFLTF